MSAIASIGIRGEYGFAAIRPDGSRRSVGRAQNLITSAGLELIGTGDMDLLTCRVGNGTTPATVGDTALGNELLSIPVDSVSYAASSQPPYRGVSTAKFLQSSASGQASYSEVSVNGASTAFSRALLADALGNVSAYEFLADELAEITYRVILTPPSSDSTFQIANGSITHACTMRAADVTDPNSWCIPVDVTGGMADQDCEVSAYYGVLGEVTGHPTAIIDTFTATADAYEAESRTLRVRCTLGPGDANDQGEITCLLFKTPLGAYQISFDPPIPKNNEITVSFTFAIEWGQ